MGGWGWSRDPVLDFFRRKLYVLSGSLLEGSYGLISDSQCGAIYSPRLSTGCTARAPPAVAYCSPPPTVPPPGGPPSPAPTYPPTLLLLLFPATRPAAPAPPARPPDLLRTRTPHLRPPSSPGSRLRLAPPPTTRQVGKPDPPRPPLSAAQQPLLQQAALHPTAPPPGSPLFLRPASPSGRCMCPSRPPRGMQLCGPLPPPLPSPPSWRVGAFAAPPTPLLAVLTPCKVPNLTVPDRTTMRPLS